MRFDCLPSSTFPSEFASREVVSLLDRNGAFESESCEVVGKLRDGGILNVCWLPSTRYWSLLGLRFGQVVVGATELG